MEIIYSNKKTINEIENLIEVSKSHPIELDLSNSKGAIFYGDNLKIMANLLEKYEKKIDLIYIDPPFNTNSSFFYTRERVSTISTEKNSAVAYDDNLDVETYLEFIRERLYLMRKLQLWILQMQELQMSGLQILTGSFQEELLTIW